MYRKFAFEGDVHDTLSLIPLATRRRLDLAGLKVSREGWAAFPLAERAILCHLPVESDDEVRVYRAALEHFALRASVKLEPIDPSESDRGRWSTAAPPTALVERLRRHGLALPAPWSTLDDETRYCLVKYSDPRKRDESFTALVRELADPLRARTLAILVGGRGRRMGGVDKGLLHAKYSDESLVSRTARVAQDAGFTRVVLVGRASAYEHLGLEIVEDRPGVEGPIAGLFALLDRERAPFVLVGCDMPSLTSSTLARLAEGSPTRAALAPRHAGGGKWEPLFAWFHPARLVSASAAVADESARSFQRWLSRDDVDCAEFSLAESEWRELEDWDEPADLARA
jgi:molybdopterin-guanine dinucleotide biosynthesis protein A